MKKAIDMKSIFIYHLKYLNNSQNFQFLMENKAENAIQPQDDEKD